MERKWSDIEALVKLLNSLPVEGFKISGLTPLGFENIPEATVKKELGSLRYQQICRLPAGTKFFVSQQSYIYYSPYQKMRLYFRQSTSI